MSHVEGIQEVVTHDGLRWVQMGIQAERERAVSGWVVKLFNTVKVSNAGQLTRQDGRGGDGGTEHYTSSRNSLIQSLNYTR